jgi:hypothetical protein
MIGVALLLSFDLAYDSSRMPFADGAARRAVIGSSRITTDVRLLGPLPLSVLVR